MWEEQGRSGLSLPHHLRCSARSSQVAKGTSCMSTPRVQARMIRLESHGLEHLCGVQTSYNMLIGVPKNEHSKRTKQNLYSLLWPTLGIHVASIHYGHKVFCIHKGTHSDSFWDVGRMKVSKLLDTSPKLLDRIIGSGNKKQKNTERDWIGDQGSHTEIPSLFFSRSSSQVSIPFLPQQDRNRNYKAEHTHTLIIHNHF